MKWRSEDPQLFCNLWTSVIISTVKNQQDGPLYQIYFILEWHSTCFVRSFRPSSGVQDCTYSNRHLSNRYRCLLASRQTAVSVWLLYIQSSTPDDGRKDRPKRVECHTIEIILRCTALWTSNLSYQALYARCMWNDTHLRKENITIIMQKVSGATSGVPRNFVRGGGGSNTPNPPPPRAPLNKI